MPKQTAIWSVDHIDYLATLDPQSSTREMSVAMSKHFKMRVTPATVSRLLAKMRTPGHEFFRNIPYRSAGAKRLD